MKPFTSIKELIRALANNEVLITALFERRKVSLRWEDATELMDNRMDRLERLIDRGLIQQNGEFLELEPNFEEFFEQVLEINIDVNTAYIKDSIESIQSNIEYYLNEKSSSRKNQYLRKVKGELRKLSRNVWRNTLDLRRNIEETYKTEPNYQIKISKLKRYDQKTRDINQLIEVVKDLCFNKEKLFFSRATDDELNKVKWGLRSVFSDSHHQLIEIQRQVINYLNIALRQSHLIEKLRKVKFLKDQFELKERSNFVELLKSRQDLLFEKHPSYSLKLSLSYLQTDQARDIIRNVQKKKRVKASRMRAPAASFAEEELVSENSESSFVNIDEVKNSFMVSGRELVDFLLQYPLPGNLDFDQRLTLYCRLFTLFPDEIKVSENYSVKNGVEYALAYPASNEI